MNSTVENGDEGAERLLRLFQELLRTLPPDTATLHSKRTDRDDGTIVWLKPVKKNAAEFCAHVEDRNLSLIDVGFGAGTTIELPSESRLPRDVRFEIILEALRQMGLATLAGRCREYFGVSWDPWRDRIKQRRNPEGIQFLSSSSFPEASEI